MTIRPFYTPVSAVMGISFSQLQRGNESGFIWWEGGWNSSECAAAGVI